MKTLTRSFLAVLLGLVVTGAAALLAQSQADTALRAAIETETVKGDLKSAIEQYKAIAAGPDRAAAAKALVRLGECYQKQGNAQANKTWERVVREFADQKDAASEARARLGAGAAKPSADEGVIERRFSSLGDCAFDIRLSADGRVLSYVDYCSAEDRVVLRDLATGRDRVVANGPTWEAAVLSRDGKQLALQWEYRGRAELGVMNVDGTGVRTVYSPSESFVLADWSPDGAWLLGSARGSKGAPATLVLVSMEGKVRPIKTVAAVGPYRTGSPRFSADGRYIVYPATRKDADGDGRSTTIHMVAVDGTGEVALVNSPPTESDWNPVFSPDNRQVVFLSDRSGVWALWSLAVANGRPQGEPKLLRHAQEHDTLIGFGPDGSLYCERWQSQSDVYVAEVDAAGARLVSGPTRVNQTQVGRTRGPVVWSPDGRSLAFTRKVNSKDTVVIHSMDTGEEKELPECPFQILAWLPDGQTLLAGSPVRRVDVKTGRTEPVTSLARASVNFAGGTVGLSPDGKTAYYSVTEPPPSPADGTRLVKLVAQSLDDGSERVLYESRARLQLFHSVTVSPDGRQIAFGQTGTLSESKAVVKVVPAAGGDAKEVFTKSWWGVAWSRDGANLLVRGDGRAGEKNGDARLFSISMATGDIRLIEGLRLTEIPMALNPDGRRLAFVGGTGAEEIVAIKNLLAAPPASR